jgi:dihydrofolate reductase
MKISIIAAVSENNVIGRQGDLPWRLRDDLKRFKRLTIDRTVIVGRKTHESILRRTGTPLAGRRTIVLSRNAGFTTAGCEVVQTLADAIALAQGEQEVFIIGGAEIYRFALEVADRLYLTRVRARVAGDVVFPAVDFSAWTLISLEQHNKDAANEYDYAFEVWERAPVTARTPSRSGNDRGHSLHAR